MKQIYISLILLLICTSLSGQSHRLQQLRDAESYDNSYSGSPATTKQAFLDSLAGFQSFADLSSILSADPPVGFLLENRSNGYRYKVFADTIPGLAKDGLYQVQLGGGKYIIINDEYILSFTDQNVADTTLAQILLRTQRISFNLFTTDSANENYVFQLPDPGLYPEGKAFVVNIDQRPGSGYYLESGTTDLQVENKPVSKYYATTGEQIYVSTTGSNWKLESTYRTDGIIAYDRYSLGSQIGKYKIEGAPISGGSSSFNRVVLNKKATQLNYFRSTRAMIGGPGNYWGIASGNVTAVTGEMGPTGLPDATRWTFGETDEHVRAQTTGMPKQEGEYTVSGWVSFGGNPSNANVKLSLDFVGAFTTSDEVPILLDSTHLGWQYFEVILNITDTKGNTDARIDVEYQGDVGDYVLLAQWSIHPGNKAEEHKAVLEERINTTTDTIYAVYRPSGGELYMGDVLWEESSNHRKINKSIEFCANTDLCRTVVLDHDYLTDSTVIIKEGVTLDLRGYTITYNGTNASLDVVAFEGTGGAGYREDQHIENGRVETQVPCEALLRIQQSLRGTAKQMYFDGNNLAKAGITDNLWGDAPLFFEFLTGLVEGCDRNVFLQRTKGQFYNVQVLRGGYGYYNSGDKLGIYGGSIENNDSLFIYSNSTASIDIELLGIEDSPLDTSYRFYFENAKSVNIENCIFNGSAEGLRANVKVKNVGNILIENNNFNMPNILIADSTSHWAIVNNYSSQGKIMDELCTSDSLDFRTGYVMNNGRVTCGNHLNYITTEDARLVGSELANSILSGVLYTNQLVLDSRPYNLFPNSSELPAGSFVDYEVIPNAELEPGGVAGVAADSTAEIFVPSTSKGIGAYATVTTLDTLYPDRYYCVSFYAYLKQPSTRSPRFVFRAGGTQNQDGPVIHNFSTGHYRRYYSYIRPETKTKSLVIRYGNTAPTDTLVITDLMLNEGRLPLTFEETNTAGQSPQITVAPGDTLLLDSDIKVSRELIVSDYAQSNKTPGLLSKTYSGFQAAYGNDGTLVEIPNNWGTASGTTDANGDLLITHGLTSGGVGIAPDNIRITNLDLSANLTFTPHTITTTSFLVRCKDATTGSAVVSGAVSLMWEAKAKAE